MAGSNSSWSCRNSDDLRRKSRHDLLESRRLPQALEVFVGLDQAPVPEARRACLIQPVERLVGLLQDGVPAGYVVEVGWRIGAHGYGLLEVGWRLRGVARVRLRKTEAHPRDRVVGMIRDVVGVGLRRGAVFAAEPVGHRLARRRGG